MAKPKIKGSTVKSRLDFALTHGGEELIQKLKADSGTVGELARTTLLNLRDFPIADVETLSIKIAQELGNGPLQYEKMGAHSAGLNRVMQKLVHRINTDPHVILAGFVREIPMYVTGDIGHIVYEPDPVEKAGRIVWTGHEETGLSHCLSSIGYAVRVLENWGIKGAHGENSECMALGGSRCVWEFRWDEATGNLRNTTQIRSDALAERIRSYKT